MYKKTGYIALLLLASFGGWAEELHPGVPLHLNGAISHHRLIDTSERPDEHVSEKIQERDMRR